MKYFLHDSNAFNDEKITELYMQFGYEGLGLFYTCLEKFALQEKPIKTAVLKKQLGVGKKLEKVWKFMEEIELISTINDETFNEKLLNNSKKYSNQKENTRKRVENFRTKHAEIKALTENVTRYSNVTKRVSNADKDNISKDNIESSNTKLDRVPNFHELQPASTGKEFDILKSSLDKYFSEGHDRIELFTGPIRYKGNFQNQLIKFCTWHSANRPAYAKLPIEDLLNKFRHWLTNEQAKEDSQPAAFKLGQKPNRRA